MEKIAEVLNQKYPQFNTILNNRSVSEALFQMRCENVDFLIVLDENENFVGLLTENDIISKALLSGKDFDDVLISSCASTNLPVATMEDSLEYALQLLENHNSRFLAVYDQFDFKGVLSIHDLVKVALVKRQMVFETQQPQRTGYPWTY